MSDAAVSTPPIVVLHLRDSPWVDGPARTIIESAARFDPSRVDYHIGVLVGAEDEVHPVITEAQNRRLSVHRLVDRRRLDRATIEQILTLVDRLNVRILHTSDLRSRVYGIMARSRRPHLIMVSTAHGWIANSLQRRMYRILDKVLLRQFDLVVLVSHAMRELVPCWWLPNARVAVLHNALALDTYFDPTKAITRDVPDPTKRVVVVSVGRLSPEKGQDLLLRAFAQLVMEFPGIELHLVGIGPLESSLRALVGQLCLDSRVFFRGYVQDMPAVYAQADLVVQSSLTEGLPNVILEAAYMRVPIIATDVGGTREIIEHGRTGWQIESGSVEALVAGLRHYFADPAASIGMADAARQRIEADFSLDIRTERMTRLYEQLVEVNR